jgi:hypothetical protein
MTASTMWNSRDWKQDCLILIEQTASAASLFHKPKSAYVVGRRKDDKNLVRSSDEDIFMLVSTELEGIDQPDSRDWGSVHMYIYTCISSDGLQV